VNSFLWTKTFCQSKNIHYSTRSLYAYNSAAMYIQLAPKEADNTCSSKIITFPNLSHSIHQKVITSYTFANHSASLFYNKSSYNGWIRLAALAKPTMHWVYMNRIPILLKSGKQTFNFSRLRIEHNRSVRVLSSRFLFQTLLDKFVFQSWSSSSFLSLNERHKRPKCNSIWHNFVRNPKQ